jgi:hypothetical protein
MKGDRAEKNLNAKITWDAFNLLDQMSGIAPGTTL